MYVPNQFFEIGIFFANNGFITILKQMTVSQMTVVVVNRVSGEESPHEFGKPDRTAAQKDMGMLCEVLDYVKLCSLLLQSGVIDRVGSVFHCT
jgi:hypothetical protein